MLPGKDRQRRTHTLPLGSANFLPTTLRISLKFHALFPFPLTCRLGSLYGSSPGEAAQVDEVLDGITDARGAIISFPFMDDSRECCARLQQSMQRFWPCFEALLERNASPPHVVGASLTVADVLLAELVDSTSEAFAATFGPQAAVSVLEPFPRLRALHEHITSLPEIQAFKRSDNWFPFPAGQVGAEYVRNVRTVLS